MFWLKLKTSKGFLQQVLYSRYFYTLHESSNEYKVGQNHYHTVSSPSKMIDFFHHNKVQKKRLDNCSQYWKSRAGTRLKIHGIQVATSDATHFFNEETCAEAKKFIDAMQNDNDYIDKKAMMSYLTMTAWDNVVKAQRSSNKSVRFDLVF